MNPKLKTAIFIVSIVAWTLGTALIVTATRIFTVKIGEVNEQLGKCQYEFEDARLDVDQLLMMDNKLERLLIRMNNRRTTIQLMESISLNDNNKLEDVKVSLKNDMANILSVYTNQPLTTDDSRRRMPEKILLDMMTAAKPNYKLGVRLFSQSITSFEMKSISMKMPEAKNTRRL